MGFGPVRARGAALRASQAIYTDDPNIALRPGWKLERLALYHRSILIAPKHRKIGVYRIEPTANP